MPKYSEYFISSDYPPSVASASVAVHSSQCELLGVALCNHRYAEIFPRFISNGFLKDSWHVALFGSRSVRKLSDWLCCVILAN